MSDIRIFYFATAAFVIPVVAVVVMNRDQINDLAEIDPSEARGTILYFTAPG